MMNFFKKKDGEEITLTIEGMHCTSCAMNIDGALEDSEGVLSAETSYAKSKATVTFDPNKISEKDIKKIIASEGYQAH